MSREAKVIVFYGIVFERGSADHNKFEEKCDDDPEPPKDRPVEMRFHGKPVAGVRVVEFGTASFEAFGLAVAGTVQEGVGWEAMGLIVPEMLLKQAPHDCHYIKAYCEKHSLGYSRLQWYAVPVYS